MDLREQLDALTEVEPPRRPVAEHVAAGRRALRRRRLVEGVVAVVVLTALGGGWALVAGGGQPRAFDPAAPAPSVAEDPEQESAPAPPWARWRDGQVLIKPAVREVDRIGVDDAGQRMVGLELRVGDDVRWYLVGADGSTHAPAYVAFDSLAEWISDQLFLTGAGGGGEQPRAGLVRFTPGGGLEPEAPGVEIIEQVRDPDLPDAYDTNDGGGRLTTAAALIDVDGERLYLLARDPSAPDFITVPISRGGPTLEDFLDFARQRYASNEQGGSEGLL